MGETEYAVKRQGVDTSTKTSENKYYIAELAYAGCLYTLYYFLILIIHLVDFY